MFNFCVFCISYLPVARFFFHVFSFGCVWLSYVAHLVLFFVLCHCISPQLCETDLKETRPVQSKKVCHIVYIGDMISQNVERIIETKVVRSTTSMWHLVQIFLDPYL